MTKKAIQLLQNLQSRSNTPEAVAIPRHIALSNNELAEAFTLVHRDVYHKVFGVNSPDSLISAIAVCDYLCDLSQRSQSEKLLLHAQVCQIAIYGFVCYNPSMCLTIFTTLVPRYEKLTQEVINVVSFFEFFFRLQLFKSDHLSAVPNGFSSLTLLSSALSASLTCQSLLRNERCN